MMDPGEKQRSTQETKTIEWLLCSPHFEDIVVIVHKDLNIIPIMSQYKEICVMLQD